MPKLKFELDVSALREDVRKLGLVLIGAGLAGTIIDSDHVTAAEGVVLFGIGLVFWLAVILLRRDV